MFKDKILVFTEILVVGFYGYIGGWILLMDQDMLKNINRNFDQKKIHRTKLIKTHRNIGEN